MKPAVGRAAGGPFQLAAHSACLLLVVALVLEAALNTNALDIDLNIALDEQGNPIDETDNEEIADEEDSPQMGAPEETDFEHGQGSRKRLKTPTGHVEKQSFVGGLLSKVRSKLPDYFDFSAFCAKFNRKYKVTEALVRQTTFLEKAVAVFKSRLAYRLGKKSYLEGINKFSDRTEAEFRLMYMASPPIELVQNNDLLAVQRQQEAIRQRQRELEQIRRDTYVPELPSQGMGDDNSEAPMSERRARKLIEEMYASHMGEREFEEAFALELDGFDVESASEGAGQGRSKLPWPGKLKSSEVAADSGEAYVAPQLEGPEDALDWSKHKCFHQVYKQDLTCGNCYVFATTALVEFYKCTELGPGKISKRKFDKTYVRDCAHKWTPHNVGCEGGSPLHTLRFIATAGMFTIREWRARRKEELEAAKEAGHLIDELTFRCPLKANRTPLKQTFGEPVNLNPKVVSPARWKEALQDGPLVASIQMPAVGVDTYEGGVHDGTGCEHSFGWHAMLLVGYGVNERGQRFWRFRNSFGPDWGDRGHFDLSMEVPAACLGGGVRVFREPLDE